MEDKKYNAQKAEPTFGDFIIAFPALGLFLSFFGVPVYWGWTGYFWLRHGFIPEDFGAYTLIEIGLKDLMLLLDPVTWIGLHKVVVILLNAFGPSLFVGLISGLALFPAFIVAAAMKEPKAPKEIGLKQESAKKTENAS